MCKTPSAPIDASPSAMGFGLGPVLASRPMDAAPRSAFPEGAARRRASSSRSGRSSPRPSSTGEALASIRSPRSGSRRSSSPGIALGCALRGVLPLPRLERTALTAILGAAGLTAWAGISIAWSIAGDRSWDWLGRGPRLPRLPRPRAPCGRALRRGPAAGVAPRRRRRGGDRLGAPRRRDPFAVPGR